MMVQNACSLVAQSIDGKGGATTRSIEIILAFGAIEIGMFEEALEAIGKVLLRSRNELADMAGMQEAIACNGTQDVQIAIGLLKRWGIAGPRAAGPIGAPNGRVEGHDHSLPCWGKGRAVMLAQDAITTPDPAMRTWSGRCARGGIFWHRVRSGGHRNCTAPTVFDPGSGTNPHRPRRSPHNVVARCDRNPQATR